MIVVNYDPNGLGALADGAIEEYVDAMIRAGRYSNQRIAVSNENVLDMFRLRIAEGVLSINDIIFYRDGDIVQLDSNGMYLTNPGSISLDIALAILAVSTKKKRESSSLQAGTV